MKLRRRRSALPRLNWRRDIDRSEPLKGQLWTRSERALKAPDVNVRWKVLAVGAAALECALMAWLWIGPALPVRSVQVLGAQHLSAGQIERVAGLGQRTSMVSVDSEAARQKLLDQVWIRSADMQLQLPGTVVIRVSEWQPVATYHAGKSAKLFLLSDQAVVLGPAAAAGQLVNIQGPAGADPHAGQVVLDPELLTAVVNIQRGLPNLIGQEVAGFVFDSCGDLTLLAKRGWKVYFGRLLTPEEFTSLHDKLSALKAIAGGGNVNYSSADLAYVNVMNPTEPAVGYKSLQAPSPSPVAAASPSPAACT
ncbi:MAG TPA: FtsQ-type POTRA domain-containing protein [Patescibacteria group bacterium]|nr:FtsQ-type POTRA domain-containing protein [Patescibacteria group bacterium]